MTGILGTLTILLALIGLGTLPLNVGGLLLILFGMVLFGLELTVTSHGLLGLGESCALRWACPRCSRRRRTRSSRSSRVAPPVIVVDQRDRAAVRRP